MVTPEHHHLIRVIDISQQNFTGPLDCSRFSQLETLICSQNSLTYLNVQDCSRLQRLECQQNNLAELILPRDGGQLVYCDASVNNLTSLLAGSGQFLKKLYLGSNRLTELTLPISLTHCHVKINNLADVSVFSPLINCEYLSLAHNSFTGSWEPLANLTKLKKLDLSGTGFTAG